VLGRVDTHATPTAATKTKKAPKAQSEPETPVEAETAEA
jgi:hypothetical protein